MEAAGDGTMETVHYMHERMPGDEDGADKFQLLLDVWTAGETRHDKRVKLSDANDVMLNGTVSVPSILGLTGLTPRCCRFPKRRFRGPTGPDQKRMVPRLDTIHFGIDGIDASCCRKITEVDG